MDTMPPRTTLSDCMGVIAISVGMALVFYVAGRAGWWRRVEAERFSARWVRSRPGKKIEAAEAEGAVREFYRSPVAFLIVWLPWLAYCCGNIVISLLRDVGVMIFPWPMAINCGLLGVWWNLSSWLKFRRTSRMRGFVMVLTAAAILVSLPACVSQRVAFGPGVSFECRLSVWPAFEPPVEYLVQKDSFGRATITEFRYRGAGGSGAKRSGVPVVHVIDAKQWAEFADAVREHDPWSISPGQPYEDGTDGATMILEIRDGERYQRVQRWAPFGHQSEKRFVEVSTAVVRLLPD